ncbi:MAG: P63C domain-containing protein [Candidatus Bipolaricaulota bacterium]|nr:P63C domain-containing protein [Candidatus Bipolaricaulota bacterium]
MSEKRREALYEGVLEIGDAKIPCAVLDDGTRVVTQREMLTALGRSPRPKGRESRAVDELPPFLATKSLQPFIDEDLRQSTKPIEFKPLKGDASRRTVGYQADALPKICEAMLKARDAGALHATQEELAKKAEILMRGLAHVGIIALIDEATGFQEIRDRLALQAILEKYLTDEWAKWTKTFPDEFYIEMFRLRDIPYPPPGKHKNWRPSYVGHWTNDIVYSRLAPGVLKELKRLNPRLPSGRRRRTFHQHLTREFGSPELRDHLARVIFLMKACTDWDDFKRRLNRAAQKYGDTIPLDLGETDERT